MSTTPRRREDDETLISIPLLTFGLLAALLSSLLFPGCGDDGGPEPEAPGAALTRQAEERLNAAGQDARKLLEAWRAIDESARAAEGEAASALAPLRAKAERATLDAVSTLVDSYGRANDIAKLDALASWLDEVVAAEKKGPRSDAVAALEAKRLELDQYRLAARPEDVALRERLGWKRVPIDFDAIVEEPWLDSDDVADVERLERTLKNESDRADGSYWIKPGFKETGRYEELLARLEKRKADYTERMKDPWEQEAMRVFEGVVTDLNEALNTSYQWTARTHKPYVIIVEKDRSWNETQVAESRAEALLQLHDVFYRIYGKDLGLRHLEKPVPVVYFRRDGYRQYANKRGLVGAAGHFEPGTGRLFTSKGTDIGTVFHEGTHQLSFYNTPGGNFGDHSFWFEEGLAEFLAGNTKTVNKETGGFDYEVGLLQIGRLNYWRQNEKKAYDLWDLVDLRYRDRDINTMQGNDDRNLMVYSQGWFLCYFLNWFDVDAEGNVVIGKPGRYRDNWLKMFAASLAGKNGRDLFLECMGMPGAGADDPRFKALEKEFLAYYEWANRKVAMKQVENNKFVPWDEVVHKGRKVGDPEDDMLELPPR